MPKPKETLITGQVDRRDVFLSFMDWLYQARRSLGLRLFYRTSDLDKVKIWDLGEDGAFFQEYVTQYEHYEYGEDKVRASHWQSVAMIPEENLPLDRPKPYNFQKFSQVYAIADTGEILRCPRCGGRGRVTYRDSEGNSHSKTCPLCKGDKEVFQYRTKRYQWFWNQDESPILSPNTRTGSTENLISKLIHQGGGLKVASLTESEVLRVSNLINPRIRDLLSHARKKNESFQGEIARRGNIIFQMETLHFVPVSYINLELGKEFGQFFLAGDRKASRRRRPPIRYHFWKSLAWLSLLAYPALLIVQASDYVVAFQDWVWFTPLASLIPVGISALIERQSKLKTHRWLIVDNSDYEGWLLSYLLSWTLSRSGRGKVTDPAFTHLLEAPLEQETSSRNSFLFHIEIDKGADTRPERIELLNLHHDSLQLYPKETSPVLKGSDHWLVVVGASFDAHEEKMITDMLNWRISQSRQPPRISVIVNGEDVGSQAYFSGIKNDFVRRHLSVLPVPLTEISESIKSGELTDAQEQALTTAIQQLLPSRLRLTQKPQT